MLNLPLLRQYKVGPLAIFDIIISYLGIAILAPLLSKIFLKFKIVIPIKSWIWLTMPIGVIFHILFRQSTPFMKMLLNPQKFDFYLALISLTIMVYFGVKDISKIK